MATVELSEAFVLGLLSDMEQAVPVLGHKLAQSRERAQTVDAELVRLVNQLDLARDTVASAQAEAESRAAAITNNNMRMATLHQEMSTFQRRAEEMKGEIEAVAAGDPAGQRQLRRQRGRMLVEIDDRKAEVEKLRASVLENRQALKLADVAAAEERDRQTAIGRQLDELQSQLPSPFLFVDLFAAAAGRAHCRFYLDRDVAAWTRELRRAVSLMMDLHIALRAGRYRLDKNSEVIGGRATATGEAMYGAVAAGGKDVALKLFLSATDPSVFFHQIFNVVRVWMLGLYLSGRHAELEDLLRWHRWEVGCLGGYVQSYQALLSRDAPKLARGLKDIIQSEWDLWQSNPRQRSSGVINLAAVALVRLARERGLATPANLGPTVPLELGAGPDRATVNIA